MNHAKRGTMKQKPVYVMLEQIGDQLFINDHPLTQASVAHLVHALDAGKAGELYYFAQHGQLPKNTPIWPGLVTKPAENGWDFFIDEETPRVAFVTARADSGEYVCQCDGWEWRGNTPQGVVNMARAALRRRFGLL